MHSRDALLGNRGQADKARALAFARDVGADMSRLETDLASDEIKATLEENFKLAEQLGLNGTSSYVVGSDILIGAVGLPALKEKVKVARCGAAAELLIDSLSKGTAVLNKGTGFPLSRVPRISRPRSHAAARADIT